LESEVIDPYCLKIKSRQRVKHQIFVFHHAGGSRISYLNWAEKVAPTTELLFFDLPGRRGSQETCKMLPAEVLEDMARHLEGLISTRFALFGHSMGAIVSLSVMQHLQTSPNLFVASGAVPPNIKKASDSLINLSDAELLKHLEELGGVSPLLLEDLQFRSWMLRLYKLDLNFLHKISVKRCPISAPILAIGGHEDPLTTKSELMAWENWTDEFFEQQEFKGGHFFPFMYREAIIQLIETNLKRKKTTN
jgi:surfactin synthase thioesterase subunit